ncbi:hypothetical protein GWK47_043318 [Chionoecetes opilio]|uniref:Uncharacterized protein n=1 Tax=Chionoecetes opilio TaxID=41210 RepID=A0A8J5CW72_CHIOP|nr:hypothetical protein GWK47_043318 [Chionoecetes opilio]
MSSTACPGSLYTRGGAVVPTRTTRDCPRNGRPSHVDQPRCTRDHPWFRRDAAAVTPNACDHVELFPRLHALQPRFTSGQDAEQPPASVPRAYHGYPRVSHFPPRGTAGKNFCGNLLALQTQSACVTGPLVVIR